MATLIVQDEKDFQGGPPTFVMAGASGDEYENLYPEPEVWIFCFTPQTMTMATRQNCDFGGPDYPPDNPDPHPDRDISVAAGSILRMGPYDRRRYTSPITSLAKVSFSTPNDVQIAIVRPIGSTLF